MCVPPISCLPFFLCPTDMHPRIYCLWAFQGACVLSGLGYNGVDARTGKTLWNRCQNVDFLNIEFANNWKELLDHWNMNTSRWLLFLLIRDGPDFLYLLSPSLARPVARRRLAAQQCLQAHRATGQETRVQEHYGNFSHERHLARHCSGLLP